MKTLVIVCAVVTMMVVSGTAGAADYPTAMQAGGDRLIGTQNTNGGWGWPLTGGSATNTVGPISMGLAKAYRATGDTDQLTALGKAGSYLLAKTNNFSPSDGYLAAELDNIFGGMAYSSYVKTNFYDKLAAGTYQRAGDATLYDTAAYVNRIRTGRSGDQANMAAWDIGVGLFAANAIGANTSVWLAGTKAEIDELDGSNYYDVIGLAGAVLGLASVGADYDPLTGEHAAASNLGDLANVLASYQIAGGGFAWNKAYVIANDGDEAIQETSYAILALNQVNRSLYMDEIIGAGAYLRSVQLSTGGWENYIGYGENNEVTGEALWGIQTVPEPATMALLGLGGLLLRRRK